MNSHFTSRGIAAGFKGNGPLALSPPPGPCRCAVCLSDVPHLARCLSSGRIEAGRQKR